MNGASTPAIWLPSKTRAKLASPAAPGGRHHEMLGVALAWIGQGLSAEALFAELRTKHAPDVTDKEIHDVIRWVVARNPQPCGFARPHSPVYGARRVQPRSEHVSPESARATAEKWLDSFHCDEADLWHVSPWRPLEDWRFDALMVLAGLYDKDERVNIVTEYEITRKADGSDKTNPSGAGVTRTRDEWMRWIRDSRRVPESEAGAWMRPNPVTERGGGKGGAFTDADVTAFRFLLIESDLLPPDFQLSMLARLSLPIAAIIQNGGNGPHAWVKVDCADADDYRATAKRILSVLKRYGFDQANKNPSRLSRLPGAQRKIGARDDGEQRLVYLNSEPTGQPIFGSDHGHSNH